jgi:hypothetical protein
MKHIAIGIRGAPYLADHGFQDMVVLPGSLYVEWALRTQGARRLRNVRFRAPVILSADEVLIEVTGSYTFREANTGIAAELEIVPGAPAPPLPAAPSKEGFQPVADFYPRLRANGNQYGSEFQTLSSVWRKDGESLARIRIGENRVIDAAVQLLAPFVMEQGRTFVLRSIERIEVYDFDLPGTVWGHATRDGHVRLFDDSGKTYLELFGVALSLLEGSRATKLAIAANFTAEPLEDALRFWGGSSEPASSPSSRATTRCSSSCSIARAHCAATRAASTRSCSRSRTGERGAGTRSPSLTRTVSETGRDACCRTAWKSST